MITSPQEAQELVVRTQPLDSAVSLEAQQVGDLGWFLTLDADDDHFPLGGPSYLVLTDGRVGLVDPYETVKDVYERLLTQPVPD